MSETFGNAAFIYFSDSNQHAIPLFSDAGILPLQFSYYELTANLMFDIRHRNAPRNIRNLFQDISNIRDFTNQNATQFGNTETEKGLGRERRHERGKNKVTDANATSLEAELYKSFKLCFIAGVSLYIIKWQHSERQGKL